MQNNKLTTRQLAALTAEFWGATSLLTPAKVITDLSTRPWSSCLGVSLAAIARHYAPKGAR